MNDKERLEEIKQKYQWAIKRSLANRIDDSDIEWLIQQAERVEELELEVNDWRDEAIKWNKRFEELEESHSVTKELLHSTISEIKRYKQALVFYADESNYREQELKGIVPPRPITFKPILHDYGSIARQALEGEE